MSFVMVGLRRLGLTNTDSMSYGELASASRPGRYKIYCESDECCYNYELVEEWNEKQKQTVRVRKRIGKRKIRVLVLDTINRTAIPERCPHCHSAVLVREK